MFKKDSPKKTHKSKTDQEISADIKKMKAEIENLTALLQRTQADFINYKKRTENARAEFVEFANAEVIATVLPVLDNLQRARLNLPANLKGDEWCKGVLDIAKQFDTVLEQLGIKKIETKGVKYNPEFHEAILQGDSGSREEILEELEAGYLLNDKILRPAKVKVGQA